MGTRGVYGFRKDGQDKLTYNHFDSYPEGLGNDVVSFIRSSTVEEMKNISDSIILIDGDDKPSEEDIKNYEKYSNLNVSERTLTSWYCLLRDTQGDLNAYKKDVRHMIDNSSFIKDSLFCEYGYIINLDSEMFEIYDGFQTKQNNNRYACPHHNGYYNCALIKEYPLTSIPENWIKEVKDIISEGEEE